MTKTLIILGAGGFAREVFWYAKESGYECFLFVDEITDKTSITIGQERHSIVKFSYFTDKVLRYFNSFIVGVGSPEVKEKLVIKALDMGLIPARTLVHPDARLYGEDISLGVGGVICPGVKVTTNVKIGNYVILNLGVTVGHDAIIDDYVTCNPGCHISGNVHLEKSSFVGTGAAIIEKLRLPTRSVLGAQGCLIRGFTESGTYVGVPAKITTV